MIFNLKIILDDLRHILGNNTTRRGIFDLFDLFQYKALNKRLFYMFLENFLNNFFITNLNSQTATFINYSNYLLIQTEHEGENNITNNLKNLTTPLSNLIRIHLTKSARVKSENKKQKDISPSSSIFSTRNSITSKIDFPKSKSLHSEIFC